MDINELPKEFLKRVEGQLSSKEEYSAFLDSYNAGLYQGLRVNTLKEDNIEGFVDYFKDFNLSMVDWSQTGFYYDNSARPGKSVYHEAGLYYIQEPSAMSVAEAAGVKPGEKVLDLCSAPGGKATALAAALKGEGVLIANEIHPARAKILSQNIERMGVTNAIVTNEAPDGLEDAFYRYFDCIVVDAPCSGEGMFRKEPEAVPNWSVENVLMCADRQRDILASAVKMLAPSGRLVYSTCTFAREEDEDNVEWLLSEYPFLSLVRTERFWPHKLKGEGHFLAVVEVTGDLSDEERKPVKLKEKLLVKDRTKEKLFNKFADEFFSLEGKKKYAEGKLVIYGDKLYKLPDNFDVSLHGIKVLRFGLDLGEFVKDRFEPSHSLAMAQTMDDVKIFVSLDEDEAAKYLHGETVTSDINAKGWCVVAIKKYPLGLGKLTANTVKNHYPKGLRSKY